MTTNATDRRIYVACLASYNAGTLHGEWIDADYRIAEEIEGRAQTKIAAEYVMSAGMVNVAVRDWTADRW